MNQDPQFPQMPAALNPNLMGPLLDWLLDCASSQSSVNGWQIGEKRYKPGKSLLVGYRWTGQSDNPHSRFATGRLCSPAEVNREFERELAKRPDLAKGGLTLLQHPAMLVWAFPYDRKLRHLPTLLDHAAMTIRLQAPNLLGIPVEGLQSEVLHYLAERSCMIRYSVQTAESTQPRLVYAKNYADDAGRETFAVMRQLNGPFNWGAEALAFDADTLTLWQAHLPGQALTWAALQADSDGELADQMGQCVAELHACRIDTPRRYTQVDVVQGLLATPTLAEQVRPEWAGRIARSVNSLLAQALRQTPSERATLHHDLKLNNFLYDGQCLGLIDMDCVCLGDPLLDLASLIANIYLNGIRDAASIESIHPLVNRLVLSYQRHRQQTLSLTDLRWQVAAALIHEVVRRSLRQLDETRLKQIKRYLALSDMYAAHCGQAAGVANVLI
ncbi:aminoglycoside phosphotransferase family protein [Methylomonas fluvii]|uniref:Aminoglycoside phosphotransferase family protein n=1 Tax=Methylomonas fluvii TaxID=1854564 RepID=A0ABR9DCI7_9GAMM|nr:aminoglycoside phosphotransferase family protein [Methylomonas fluvii]MBD9360812.1 aminoglycoside phosphotransferase family protein [Methylomonas fluvii]